MNNELPVVHMIGSALFIVSVCFAYIFGKALWVAG